MPDWAWSAPLCARPEKIDEKSSIFAAILRKFAGTTEPSSQPVGYLSH